MDNWFAYYNSSVNNDIPFIKSALLHYSFERTHLFYDGNGRMGRLLYSNYLMGIGLEKIKAVSFSMAIGKRSSGYYDSMAQSGNNYLDCTWLICWKGKLTHGVMRIFRTILADIFHL